MGEVRRRGLGSALLLALLLCCAEQRITIADRAPAIRAPDPPLELTLALRQGGFELSHLNPDGIMDYFAQELREARLCGKVVHPLPLDANPEWQLELSANDRGVEDGYTLELTALLLRNRRLVETYRSSATHALGETADVHPEDLALLARSATRQMLQTIAADGERLRREYGF